MTRISRFATRGIWLALPLAILPTATMAQAPVPEPVNDRKPS